MNLTTTLKQRLGMTLLSCALSAGACAAVTLAPAGGATDHWNVYSAPPVGAKPGDILHAQKRTDAPKGSAGWNVVYVSEIAPGRLAYVSGEIYLPESGGESRDVVLWNHETAGLADACAPSRRGTREEGHDRVPALAALLARGYVVVMSDYPGLGLPGPAFYMAGQPNARASLDMLRVARNFPGARASSRYVMYGWSQGGQTTMWAESIAASYVPEFTGLGAALVAPAVRIRELTLNSMTAAENAGYVISTLSGIQAYHPELKYRDFLAPEAMEQLPVLANGCFDVWSAAAGVRDAYQPDALAPGSPWWNAMTAVDDFTPQGTMPFAIFQGTADTTTPPNLTLRERTALCSAGNAVQYQAFDGLDHSAVVPEAARRLPDWFADRFAGKPAQNDCAAL